MNYKKVKKEIKGMPPKTWVCEQCGKVLDYPKYFCELCKIEILFSIDVQKKLI